MNRVPALEIQSPQDENLSQILTPDAVVFLAELESRFGVRRLELLERRKKVQAEIDAGKLPDFLDSTLSVRQGDWKVAPYPAGLADRRVEITGPVDRKMVINALNSGARVYMADFEDSHAPTWSATLAGQVNLRDAVRGTIALETGGKKYRLNDKTAILFVRPRGWHLGEKHVRAAGKPMSASLFDFGLFFFHNAKELIARGFGPYFYLPKMESHLEARLWNDVFVFSQKYLGIPNGTIKATVLIETILASFEMDEILYELKDHSAGLNCGRWDYIFSFIKKFRNRPDFLLPERAQVTMREHFLKSYCELLIKTCHRRGIHAMGGMAAQIPIKDNAEANREAMQKVFADKEREVGLGHDGTWVAHPALVSLAKEVFDSKMSNPNQIDVRREDTFVTAKDLIRIPTGTITETGLRNNISVGLQYLEAWLRGNGCVPLYHLMEDAATAEIARAQLWQWIRHQGKLADGRVITATLVRQYLQEELTRIKTQLGDSKFSQGKFALASQIFDEITTGREFVEFLTVPAYEHI